MPPETHKPPVELVRFFNMTTDEQALLRETAPYDFIMLARLANEARCDIRQEFYACLGAMDEKNRNAF